MYICVTYVHITQQSIYISPITIIKATFFGVAAVLTVDARSGPESPVPSSLLACLPTIMSHCLIFEISALI